MIAMRQISGIDDNVKDTVNNHDKGDANDAASSFRTRGETSGYQKALQLYIYRLYSCPQCSDIVGWMTGVMI